MGEGGGKSMGHIIIIIEIPPRLSPQTRQAMTSLLIGGALCNQQGKIRNNMRMDRNSSSPALPARVALREGRTAGCGRIILIPGSLEAGGALLPIGLLRMGGGVPLTILLPDLRSNRGTLR